MTKDEATNAYGVELGAGIKQGMQGLNTMCSPKKRKTCTMLTLVPLIGTWICMIVGAATGSDFIIGLILIFGLANGLHCFYVGKVKRGLLFTFTIGLFTLGSAVDLFKLTVTKTFKDANGFPLIY